MTAIAGLRGTGDWGTDERPKDFRNSILWVNPNGSAPIFALTGRTKKKVKTDPEFSWWAEPNNLVRLQVAGALLSSDTLVTVDSSDPAAATLGIAYGGALHLKPGDHLLVEPSSDAAAFTQEVVEVTQVLSNTQFMISRGAQGTTPDAIGNDAFLLLIGSAYGEGTDAPSAVSRNPVKYSNYTQIFKDTYELTGTADVTEARTGDPWSNDKKRKSFDHARAIELAMLFGRKHEGTDANGKPKRTMGGLREQVANVTVFSSAVTAASFENAIGPAFDFDLGGGDDTRVAFAGNTALVELAKVIQGETGVTLEKGPVIEMWGMKFREWVTTNGRILFKSHPLMSQHSIYKKSAFIIDFNAINYVHLKNRDTKAKDDVQSKTEDIRKGFFQTECSLMVDGGGLSCAYLGNISAT